MSELTTGQGTGDRGQRRSGRVDGTGQRTAQTRIGEDREGQGMTGQDKAGQGKTGQDKTEHGTGQETFDEIGNTGISNNVENTGISNNIVNMGNNVRPNNGHISGFTPCPKMIIW